ncbi:hypothetical protein [Dysgonomonas termitidis]|uniref:Uncharacterized protein n=1 Tax=Dysgonomonas termitidis TaxID=1516126 RepID=A0ABV9KVN3_9BACT
METKEFEGIDIPEQITDPEEREVFALLKKAQNLMDKKHVGYALLVLFDESKIAISFQGDCQNCLERIIRKVLQIDNKFISIVIKALSMYFFDKAHNSTDNTDSDDAKVQELIRHAFKNDPAGN